MNRLAALILSIATALLLVSHGAAFFPSNQAVVRFQDPAGDYTFGEQVTFHVQIESSEPVREVLVYITPEGQPTVWERMQVDDQGIASQQVDVRQLPLLPFAEVGYHFEAILTDGRTETSQTYTFHYNDNRFAWKSLESEMFQAHWYGENAALGQDILNIAQRGYEQAQTILEASLPGQVQIYAYESIADYQSAIGNTQPWMAGHASPELNNILVSVPPGPEQKLELERQIPHEIMHILQSQVMGESFATQPTWLVEGMASLTSLYPDPEYQRLLEASVQNEQLMPMRDLCAPFPRDAGPAYRAYAQSESFVRFLHQKYGRTGLLTLIEQYQNGLGCEEGITTALGISMSQLEQHWMQEVLGVEVGSRVLRNLSPFLLLSLFILIPAGLAFLPINRRK